MNNKPTIKDWIFATRFWSFPVSSLPALIGVVYSIYKYPDCGGNWWLGLIAIVGAVLFHAAGNLISDYNDYKYGVDRKGNVVGTEMLTSGLFAPKQVLAFGLVFLFIGIALGMFLVWKSGAGLLWVGLIGFFATVFYYVFKFKALGDLLIFIIYGPAIVMGASYATIGFYDWNLFLVALPLVFITVSVLHANNTRDMKNDCQAGIKTFAMVLGYKVSIIYYYILNLLPYVFIIFMVVFGILPWVSLIAMLTVPLALKNCRAMSKIAPGDVSSINGLDKSTAQLQLPFGTLQAIALFIVILV